MRVGVVNNLNAKKNSRKKINAELLGTVADGCGYIFDTASIGEIDEVVEYFYRKEIQYLVVNGGDGTVQRVLTAWINKFGENSLPRVLMLAGGATNTIMNGIGQKVRHPVKTFADFVTRLKSDDFVTTRLNLLKVEYDDKKIYGASFANGILYKLEKKYFDDGKPGVLGVFFEVLQIILGIVFRVKKYIDFIRPAHCPFYADGEKLVDIVMASGSSILKKPFPVVDPFKNLSGDIYFLISNLNFGETLINLFRIAFGKSNKIDGGKERTYSRGTAAEIYMECNQGFTVDGELFQPENPGIRISKGPEVEFVII